MTKNRIQRLKEKISQSRWRLFDTHPFFAILLMHLKFVADTQIKTISTNGRCIYFNPDFLEKLYTYEIDYILCHQVMHIVQGDIWRAQNLANIDYHHACDVVLNNKLLQLGFEKEKYPHIGKILFKPLFGEVDETELTQMNCYLSQRYSLYSFDEKTRSKYVADDDSWWDRKNDTGQSLTIIIDTEESDARLKSYWDAVIAISQSMSKGADMSTSLNEYLERKIKLLKKAQANWRKILNEFVQEEICDYSFTPPDRRFQDNLFFLPDYNELNAVQKNILFMVDTSGSVSDEKLEMVYSEICGAIEQFNGNFQGILAFFDTMVYPPIAFENISDVLCATPVGGGGTDFRPIFDFINQNYRAKELSCVIIFTDGMGIYPEENQQINLPVLWIIDNENATPPFGKIARLNNG